MNLLILFSLMQDLPIEPVVDQFEKITNPILAILIFILVGGYYFVYKLYSSEKKLNVEKDDYIKEQNQLFLKHAIKNVEVMKGLQTSIEHDSSNHRVIEDLLRQNNSYLQTIMRELKT